MSLNEDYFVRANQVIPGGVNSPVRSFRSVGGTPYFVNRAEGPYVWDGEGNCYIDYVMSYGPGIAGHSHPQIIDAIQQASGNGATNGTVSWTPTAAGTYYYQCSLHNGMYGTITVN